MNKRIFAVLAFCMFSSTLGIGIVIPLFPLYVQQMGATGLWLGVMFSAYAVSNSIFSPISGRIADRKGKKWLLTFGLLAYALLSLGYIFAGSIPQLAMVRFVQGIAGAMTFPIANAYIGDLSPEEQEGKWMSYSGAVFYTGFGLGPLIGGAISQQFGMTAAFATLGAFNLLAFIAALLFLPESKTEKRLGEDGHEFRPSFREIGKSSMVRGLFGMQLMQVLGGAGIGTFLPIYAAGRGLSPALIGVLLTVNMLSMTVLIPLGGIIADRFNRRTITIASGLLIIPLMAVIPLASSFPQLLVILVMQGVNAAVSVPSASAITVEEGRKYGMGSTMSVFFLAQGIGMVIGPVVSGQIADTVNIESVFYFGSVMFLVGVGMFIVLTRRIPSRKAPGSSERGTEGV